MGTLDSVAIFAFLIVFALFSKRIQGTAITPPTLFVGFGLLMGPQVLGIVVLDFSSHVMHQLAELTLVMVLFTDAANIDFPFYMRNRNLTRRLLGIGLPLTIAAGFGVAALLFDNLTLLEAAILAVILAPTDAALGQAVVSNEKIPHKIRQALNIESGLNDGIAVPVLKALLAAVVISVGSATGGESEGFWTVLGKALGYGMLIGFVVGRLTAKLMDKAMDSKWMSHTYRRISLLAVPLLSYVVSEHVGGSGFIAAFIAGITMGTRKGHPEKEDFEFAHETGELLSYITWIVFGAAIVGPSLVGSTWPIVLYAVLSLTVIRMLPVAISLVGSGSGWETNLFLGWFGPRGLASIVFLIVAIHEPSVQGADTITRAVVWTILLSVVLHGATAHAGANLYASRQPEQE